jgi:nitroreductase
MRDERLFETIFLRRSIRRFDMAPLPDETVAGVLAFAHAAVPLVPGLRTEFVVKGAGETKGLFNVDAPHYLCFFSESRGAYLMNAGFVLQQVDLHLSASGLGACWLGGSTPKGRVPEARGGLSYVVMLAFGAPAQPLHRTDPAGFRRSTLPEIADLDSLRAVPDAAALLEPVRLAPSAMNSQPWRLSGDGSPDVVRVARERLGLKEPFVGRMNRVDVGIALCHLALSAGHRGLAVEIGTDVRFQAGDNLPQAFVRFGKEKGTEC